jgi:hypothetical protein
MRRKRSVLEKLALMAALATGAAGCESLQDYGGIPASVTDSATCSHRYSNSVGFCLEDTSLETLQGRLDAEIRKQGIEILRDYLVGSTPLEPIADFLEETLPQGTTRRVLGYFVKTKAMRVWDENVRVCLEENEGILVALAYDPGSEGSEDYLPLHLNGLSYNIYSPPLGQFPSPGTELQSIRILNTDEATSEVPNFYVRTFQLTPKTLMNLVGPSQFNADQVFIIGQAEPYSKNATVIVTTNCGSIDTTPDEPDNSPPEPPEQNTCSGIPEGKFVGTGLERFVVSTLANGATEEYRDYNGTLLISFDSEGNPRDYSASRGEFTTIYEGYTDTQNGMAITVRDIDCGEDRVTISVEADFSPFEMRGTGTETYTFYRNDSRGDLFGTLEYHFVSYDGSVEETTRTTGWGVGPLSEAKSF